MEGQLTLSPVMNIYLDAFKQLQEFNRDAPIYILNSYRNSAIDTFKEVGFPTLRNEDWKYSSLAQFHHKGFLPGLPSIAPLLGKQTILEFTGLKANKLVFIDGVYSDKHSEIIDNKDNIVISGWASRLTDSRIEETLEEQFQAYSVTDNAFLLLNTAFSYDGAFVYIPKNVRLEFPVLLIYISSQYQSPRSFYPSSFIIADENSQATIIEAYQHEFIEQKEVPDFYNTATHFQLHENAVVNYHKLHTGNGNHFFVSNTSAKLERNATFNAYHVNLDGALVRNNVEVNLDGEGAHADLKGLYAIDGKEHVDNHVVVRHNAPHCTSNQLYKGLMDGHSTGVFNGRIYVKEDAQKTNAFQSNKNVLLSPDANAYSKPQLEIFADDVKCSHGSTTGQIDKTALFYLQARGIDKTTALAMLNEAFAADVIHGIELEPLKKWYEQAIAEKLHSENFIS